MKEKDFVHQFNELEIRKGKRSGSCKVCDCEIKDKDIVYIHSFRNRGNCHICLDCWDKINNLVLEYKTES